MSALGFLRLRLGCGLGIGLGCGLGCFRRSLVGGQGLPLLVGDLLKLDRDSGKQRIQGPRETRERGRNRADQLPVQNFSTFGL